MAGILALVFLLSYSQLVFGKSGVGNKEEYATTLSWRNNWWSE
jgi:hypothetical protein